MQGTEHRLAGCRPGQKLLTIGAGDNVVRLLPPLMVSDADIADAVAASTAPAARSKPRPLEGVIMTAAGIFSIFPIFPATAQRHDRRGPGHEGCPRRSAEGQREAGEPLKGRMLAMIFERPSTRTRVSFEVGMKPAGRRHDGAVIQRDAAGTRRNLADTARVLSRYRRRHHDPRRRACKLTEMAAAATVPVINGLTDDPSLPGHGRRDDPRGACGPAEGPDGGLGGRRQQCRCLMDPAGGQWAASCASAAPEALSPPRSLLTWAATGAEVTVTERPEEAVAGAACVVTDVWVSMHDGGRAGTIVQALPGECQR